MGVSMDVENSLQEIDQFIEIKVEQLKRKRLELKKCKNKERKSSQEPLQYRNRVKTQNHESHQKKVS